MRRLTKIPDTLVKCKNGHIYDRNDYGDKCPVCWAIGIMREVRQIFNFNELTKLVNQIYDALEKIEASIPPNHDALEE